MILVVATLGLTVYTLVDCLQTDQARVRNLPKAGWLGIIVVALVAGPVAWLLAGRPRTVPPGSGQGPARPRGPEDDPDFLRNL